MLNKFAAVAVASVALAAPLAISAPSVAQARTTGQCSTGKGVLRATRTSAPNGRNTLHQVFWNTNRKVKGKTAFAPTYHFHHVVQPRGAIGGTFKNGVGQSVVFQTRGRTTPSVTVVWRAKTPFTFNRYQYASCTVAP